MEKKNILLGIPTSLLNDIEHYRKKNNIKTRTRALLDLITKGLEK